MTSRRLASLLACLAVLAPAGARLLLARPRAPRACTPEGRGEPPRGWIGCSADAGMRRDLAGMERIALGLPLDLDTAGAEELACVPGLSARLAAAVVADREARGPFADVDDLERVRGIGPVRLARARPHLTVGDSRPREAGPRARAPLADPAR